MDKNGEINWILISALVVFGIVIFWLIVLPRLTMAPVSSLVNSSLDIVDKESLSGFSYELRSDGILTFSSGTTKVAISPASASPLSGSIAEKAAKAAKEAGLSRADAEIVLKLISQESEFKHCCVVAGKNTVGTCTASAEETCGEDKILTSGGALAGAGSSKGVMQLNNLPSAHPCWFLDGDAEKRCCENTAYKLDCVIKKNAGCEGKTAYNMDCNIRLGVRYLMWAKAYRGGGKHYTCHNSLCDYDVTYYGWDAALRQYNGWFCPNDVQCKYVDHVNGKDISSFNGVLDATFS